MSDFDPIEFGEAVGSRSLRMLGTHPKLLALPALAVAWVVALFFLAWYPANVDRFGLVVRGDPSPALTARFVAETALVLWGMAAGYVLSNAALVHCTARVLDGERPSLAAGVRAALARWRPLLAWAALYATVGALLRLWERRSGESRLTRYLLGVGWGLLTFFVVPAVVLDGESLRGAFGRSKDLMVGRPAETVLLDWGLKFLVQVVGFLGAAAVAFGIPIAVSVALGPDAVPFGRTEWALAAGVYVLVVAVVGLGLVVVSKTAVYRYATREEAPLGVDPEPVSFLAEG